MKCYLALKKLLRQGGLRLLLLLVVSVYAGYLFVLQADDLLESEAVASVWNQPTLDDCLLMDGLGRGSNESYGYNSSWPEMVREFEAIDGVQELYNSIFVLVYGKGVDLVSGYAVSDEWLQKCNIPLSSGTWERYQPDAGYVPVVLSYAMRNQVKVGDVLEEVTVCVDPQYVDPDKGERVKTEKFSVKVTGFLMPSGAVPNFGREGTISNPQNTGLQDWYTNQAFICMPVEPLEASPGYEKYQYSMLNFYAVQLDAETAGDEEKTQALIDTLARRGIGTAATPQQVVQKVREDPFIVQENVLSITTIVLYLGLLFFSVVTFQTAFIYERKKTLATLHLMGIPWKAIGIGWMIMCTVASVLGCLGGMVIGTYHDFEGVWYFPISAWLYLLPLALLLVYGITIYITLRSFAKQDAILLLHED